MKNQPVLICEGNDAPEILALIGQTYTSERGPKKGQTLKVIGSAMILADAVKIESQDGTQWEADAAAVSRAIQKQSRAQNLPLAIHLPNPGKYARTWKKAKELAKTHADQTQTSGKFYGETPATIYAGFLRALDNRINARDPKTSAPRGRKDSPQYRAAAARDARRLLESNARRVRFYQLETAEAARRFSHRLARQDD